MSGAPALSIVVPVCDEEDNVAPLSAEPLPILARRAPRGRALELTLSGPQAGLVAVVFAAIVGALGWPDERVPPVVVALVVLAMAAIGFAIAHNIQRWVRAQRHGVFRVRRVV